MHQPLLGPDQHLALLAITLALCWFGFWAERRPLLGKVPGIVWILVLGALLSNVGIVPLEAPLYGVVMGFLLPLAIPLLLFKARFGQIISDSGKVLLIFFLGSLTVCAGGLVASLLFDLGPVEPKIAATYVAAWIGGMVSMLSISQMTELTPTEFSVALSASAPVSIIGLTLLCLLPSIPFIRRNIPSRIIDAQPAPSATPIAEEAASPLLPSHIMAGLALSATICAASHFLIVSGLFPASWRIETYNLFIITILALLVANLFPRPLGRLRGDFDLGMVLMYLFFAAIGMSTNAVVFLTSAPLYFLFGLTIILVHLGVLLALARLFRFDLAEAIIGSGANIVGAAPAAGIASSKGWKSLVTAGIATGMLGKAVANFYGLAMYELLR